ncbi:hypothetical protein CH341_16600 [Rhodoplanes roseus]|uniref:Uncharacterized protein n=1 Tax=Rhodoplanes roseus TaxID=29409 RepID=A0A327KY41_9BRAD|nr:hypothetical protein CH341_16600 [Rhodoplanes roseus]
MEAVLARLGLAVPPEDLPFLQKTLARQRELLAAWVTRVPPDTEPALVFRVLPTPGGAASAD